jgi:hypothetical protein
VAWRGVHITRRTHLSLADKQIVARQDKDKTRSRSPIASIAACLLGEAEKTETEGDNQMVLL